MKTISNAKILRKLNVSLITSTLVFSLACNTSTEIIFSNTFSEFGFELSKYAGRGVWRKRRQPLPPRGRCLLDHLFGSRGQKSSLWILACTWIHFLIWIPHDQRCGEDGVGGGAAAPPPTRQMPFGSSFWIQRAKIYFLDFGVHLDPLFDLDSRCPKMRGGRFGGRGCRPSPHEADAFWILFFGSRGQKCILWILARQMSQEANGFWSEDAGLDPILGQ